MRYLNISMILASTVFLTLACGDSGTDGADENATETAGDGDGDGGDGDGDGDAGDGDGDGGDGDGDAGDGDGDGDGGDGDGDGDGDGGDGDGDGDGGDGDGDGDGDLECPPLGNTECDACMAENCCDEIMACAGNDACVCMQMCIGGGGELEECLGECMIDPNGLPQELMAIRACQMMNCGQQCAMP